MGASFVNIRLNRNSFRSGIALSVALVSSGNFINRRNCPIRVRSMPSVSSSSAWDFASPEASKSANHSAIWTGLNRKTLFSKDLYGISKFNNEYLSAIHWGRHFFLPPAFPFPQALWEKIKGGCPHLVCYSMASSSASSCGAFINVFRINVLLLNRLTHTPAIA